ncbi:hypothetical protein AAK882_06220 [Carnobacteriaceae bacterium 52-44]
MSKKKKKRKKNEIESMTEEELFGFYFIAGYTSGGAPYGITMEEAEEQGLLEEEKNNSDSFEDDLPF